MSRFDNLLHFHKTHRLASHVLFWTAVWVIAVVDDSYQAREDGISLTTLSYYGLTLLTQIPTAYFLAYFIIPRLYSSKNYGLTGSYFILGLYGICVLSRIIYVYVREPMVGIAPNKLETLSELFTNLPKLFYIYFFRNLSLASVFLVFKFFVDQYALQKRSLLQEKQRVERELKQLKAQLNPHFLFNTLNNIYSLSLANSSATSDSIARLADILDYLLYQCHATYVPLAGEIQLVTNYIELEKLRYTDRLQVRFTTSIDQSVQIAPLLLLTIVENAFKHGASNDMGSPTIAIDLQSVGGIFTFNVVNSIGSAYVSDRPAGKPTETIGLANLKHQLQLIYGNHHQLHIEPGHTFFKVTLQIDLNTLRSDHEEDSVFAGR